MNWNFDFILKFSYSALILLIFTFNKKKNKILYESKYIIFVTQNV